MEQLTSLYDSRTWGEASLSHAILTSQPPSGGLYTPMAAMMPKFSHEDIGAMVEMNYQARAKMITKRFNLGISEPERLSIIDEAYGPQWHRPEIAPVKQVWKNMYSLHLGYGPTFAFKNFALEVLPRLLEKLQPGKKMTTVWGSSGDTVNAAHNGVRGTPIKSAFMLPAKGPSFFQALQAKEGIVDNPNAFTVFTGAPFDTLQDVVKKINSPAEQKLKEQYWIISFNSINIARILVQTIYYFHAYAEMLRMGKIKNGDEVIFSVPSGNFGDALAALYARDMWLPIKSINVATNENDMLHRFFETGKYQPKTITTTNAPSQDISKSSNFERALLWACNDPKKVAQWFHELSNNGFFEVDAETLKKLRTVFTSSTCNNGERIATIDAMSRELRHTIDPHSASAAHPIIDGKFPDDISVIFLETSHALQFAEELKKQWIIVPKMPEFDKTLRKMRKQKPQEGVHFLRAWKDPEEIMETVKRALQILYER